MLSDTQPDERLDAAIQALREARIDEFHIANAETQILAKFRPRDLIRRVKLLLFATTGVAGVAGAFAVLAIMTPSSSVAADLERVVRNGDHGLRHVTQWTERPDGSLKKGMECYATDDQARMIFPGFDQIVVRRGETRRFHPDGAETVEHYSNSNSNPSILDEIGGTTKLLRENAHLGRPVKDTVERGIVVDGKTVDRYTSDWDEPNGRGPVRHFHVVTLADPTTNKPIRADTSGAGFPKRIMTWDFSIGSRDLVEGPKVDPARIYDITAERAQILADMASEGQLRVVHGHKVWLKVLVIDERGDAVAIAGCDWAYPGNYAVRLNGRVVSDAAQTEAEARRYMVAKPIRYKQNSYQVFYGIRSFAEPALHWPNRVRLEIPVVENQRLVGYARFDGVQPMRVWVENSLLNTQYGFFWEHSKPQTAQPAVAVK